MADEQTVAHVRRAALRNQRTAPLTAAHTAQCMRDRTSAVPYGDTRLCVWTQTTNARLNLPRTCPYTNTSQPRHTPMRACGHVRCEAPRCRHNRLTHRLYMSVIARSSVSASFSCCASFIAIVDTEPHVSVTCRTAAGRHTLGRHPVLGRFYNRFCGGTRARSRRASPHRWRTDMR